MMRAVVERAICMCICQCFDVSESELKQAIKEGYDSIEKLSEYIQVGSHCGGCVEHVEKILDKSKSRNLLWPL